MTTLSRSLYTYKLQQARRIFDAHNYLRRPQPGDTRISFDDFKQKLVALGGISNELIKQCSEEDIESCGVTKLVARRLALVFATDLIGHDEEVSLEPSPLPRTLNSERITFKSPTPTDVDTYYQETGKTKGPGKTRWPYHNQVPLPDETRTRLGWDDIPGLQVSCLTQPAQDQPVPTKVTKVVVPDKITNTVWDRLRNKLWGGK